MQRICFGIILLLAGYAAAADKVQLTLDWKPEPEFGGFYAAQTNGTFAKHGLDVTLKSAGEGAPTWQLVATGKTLFATTAADQVLIARSQDADVVALFTVYQTFPQGIMVHKARGFATIDDVFKNPGTLAAEDDTWLHFLPEQVSIANREDHQLQRRHRGFPRQGRLFSAMLRDIRADSRQGPGRRSPDISNR